MEEIIELGSVLELVDGAIPVMVVGYFPYSENNNRVYDYLCIPHLLGAMGSIDFFMIDEDAIKNVLHHGYRDKSAEAFFAKLKELSMSMDIKEAIIGDLNKNTGE